MGLTVIASAAEKDRAELEATGAQFIARDVPDLGAAVRTLVPGGVHAALNTVPGSPVGLAAVRDGGLYRSVSALPESERGIDVARVGVKPDAAGLAYIVELAFSGAITTAVARSYPVVEAADAYRAMLDGSGRRGKLVLVW
jgi:NADPH2:quinone reductase